jgi:small subunit ribosomal protein S14
MTTSDHTKVLKQIGKKPGKYAKYLKHNTPRPRKDGAMTRKCIRCGRTGGHIRRYGLHLCRHCFREKAVDLGFKQYK